MKIAYFSSADLKLAGAKHFLETYKVKVLNSKYFENQGHFT